MTEEQQKTEDEVEQPGPGGPEKHAMAQRIIEAADMSGEGDAEDPLSLAQWFLDEIRERDELISHIEDASASRSGRMVRDEHGRPLWIKDAPPCRQDDWEMIRDLIVNLSNPGSDARLATERINRGLAFDE